ncbi:hypothetical protein [Sulfuricurvum sp.]|uniref:hypothetical protein n=1 Tax=Sulfuricurvum sp. TaxID=2025608 RepID=UPI002E2FAF8E|nr:hypothetical protein [Sulfuricurvum sp.]HEX5330563.1 hypothetical protein [Sulfuricurvum sp.]
MRVLFLFTLLLTVSLVADSKQRLFNLYQQGNYLQACNLGHQGFLYHQSDEAYISLYAFSCLKADVIERLAGPIALLNQTKESRINSAYFSLILMQKSLLMEALYDNKSFQNLKFPTSTHTLSKVFDLYLKNPQPTQMVKEYKDALDSRVSYKLYTTEINGRKSIAIDEYYDKILSHHHVY